MAAVIKRAFTPGYVDNVVRVIEQVADGKRNKDRLYLVEYKCCGVEKVVAHSTLHERMRKQIDSMCVSCRRKQQIRDRLVPLKVGDIVSNAEVLEVFGTVDERNIEYEIRYLCCGEEDLLKHSALLRRRTDGVVQCHKCATQERTSPSVKELLSAKKGVMDASGCFWPHLGKMGFRGAY